MKRDNNENPAVPVTIVVPVRNSVDTITRCVNALLEQDYPRELLRIIVVDNGSTDGTREKLGRVRSQILVLDEPIKGSSAARNAGILAADTDLIAFTDADCIADPMWVGELIKCHLDHPAAGFIGGLIDTYRKQTTVQHFFSSHFNQEGSIKNPSTPSVITANMLARKTDLLRVGLFDVTILRGQDIDLSFRAAFEHGVTFAYADAAIVRHVHVATVGALFRKGTQHGLGLYYLLGKHSDKIGMTRTQRLFRAGTYRRILKNFWRAVSQTLGGSRSDQPLSEGQRAFYEAIFDFGKQVGLLLAMIRRPQCNCGTAGSTSASVDPQSADDRG